MTALIIILILIGVYGWHLVFAHQKKYLKYVDELEEEHAKQLKLKDGKLEQLKEEKAALLEENQALRVFKVGLEKRGVIAQNGAGSEIDAVGVCIQPEATKTRQKKTIGFTV
jgi:hypothetical protein